MNRNIFFHKRDFLLLFFISVSLCFAQESKIKLHINELDYYEAPGINYFVFSNLYDGNFSDSKITGVEVIHHGVRTVTNGDVRLSPTPAQWDPCPTFIDRKVDKPNNTIVANLSYPKYNFNFCIKTETRLNGILLSVHLDNPLPKELEGLAGFNLEFLPSAYFEKGYIIDNRNGVFPLYPAGSMEKTKWGTVESKPIAAGKSITFAPEDPERRISVTSLNEELALYDGRSIAQNGWFVLRSLIPADKKGKVIEWMIEANSLPNWIRQPMISHSQVGYHPSQNKTAVIEFDVKDKPDQNVKLFKVKLNGEAEEIVNKELNQWGKYLRYKYYTFDFSSVKENGLYFIQYKDIRTAAFRISEDVYKDTWHATNDIFFPVQMDHMFVNEAYRVWHGASHLDDALQAPVNHEHFDLYKQGPSTDTKYKPGEHIPGLNIGGWFDAGDHDLRTQTHYAAVMSLVNTWESFKVDRDETTIDQNKKHVEIHIPDGKIDILQQIEHGTLMLIAQHRSCGHAIPGIIVSELSQYTHLGDALTITDNLLYNPNLQEHESDGFTSGKFDDRWAFTSKSTPLNYGSIAALAAAGRALRGYNDELANECLKTAVNVWDEEHSHEPDIFRFGNTTGGNLDAEELSAALQLLISTKESKYAVRINELFEKIEDPFGFVTNMFARAIPFMDSSFKEKVEVKVKIYSENLSKMINRNPFGVPITTGGWAGSGAVVGSSINNYILHKAFPHLIDKESVFRGLNYIYGTHPYHNLSLVSGVGTRSKKVAYGNNRADFSFIAGGVVPGILIIKPDFPENKEDWPFLWGENEYVIGLGASYIYLVHAINDLLNEK